MRELIDQRKLRAACQQRVEVHLLQRAAAIIHGAARDGLEAFQQRLGFLAAVGFHHAHDDVGAFTPARLRRGQHLECLADAWRGTHEDLQAATRSLLRVLQQRVR